MLVVLFPEVKQTICFTDLSSAKHNKRLPLI